MYCFIFVRINATHLVLSLSIIVLLLKAELLNFTLKWCPIVQNNCVPLRELFNFTAKTFANYLVIEI